MSFTSNWSLACRLGGLLMAICSASCGEVSAQRPAPRAELNLDQIVAGLTRFNESFSKPFALSYRQDYERVRDPNDPTGEKRRIWLEVDMARRGSDVFCHIKNDIGEGPLIEMTVYWKDGVAVEQRGRGITIWPFLIGQGMNYFNYTNSLFVDAYRGLQYGDVDSLRMSRGRTPSEIALFLLPRMIRQRQRDYRVRDKQEEIDGHWCHVVERPSRDVIWIDVSHGFVARQRTFSYLDVKIYEWHNRDLVERAPGIWLPAKQERRTFFNAASPANRRGMLDEVSHTVLKSVSFEPLSDERFTVPIPDDGRVLISDNVRRMNYFAHPKSADPMETVWRDVTSSYWWPDQKIGTGRVTYLANFGLIEFVAMLWLLRRSK